MKRAKDFVCPVPTVWADIHRKLTRIAEQRGLPKPPVPLILAAWWETSNLDKMIRWKETIKWAEEHGLTDQIPEVAEEQKHYIGD